MSKAGGVRDLKTRLGSYLREARRLVKRYVDEPGSAGVRDLLARGLVATCRLSHVEIASALLARRHREGALSGRDLERALAALRIDMGSIPLVELVAEVAREAVELLARHPLRAGHSIQLASCLHLRRRAADEVRVLANDWRLDDAARAEGLPVVAA